MKIENMLVVGIASLGLLAIGNGCMKSSLSMVLQQLKNDPAAASISITTPWGGATVTRSGGAYAGQPISIAGSGINVGALGSSSIVSVPSVPVGTNSLAPVAEVTSSNIISAPAVISVTVPKTANINSVK